MSALRRTSRSTEISQSVDKIMAGLEDGGFDKATTLVIGGAALAFANIRPGEDLDIMVPGAKYKEMEKRGKTPGGLDVIPKPNTVHSPFLEVSPNSFRRLIIPTDITFPHHELQAHSVLDDNFLKQIAEFDRVNGFPYLPPALVAEHKASLPRLRRKDRRDIGAIARHLAQQSYHR